MYFIVMNFAFVWVLPILLNFYYQHCTNKTIYLEEAHSPNQTIKVNAKVPGEDRHPV